MDCIRIGEFEIYPSERRLLAAGQPLELGARAFDLLLALAERPGRLVSKSALLERVWPKLVVEENNLAAQVASLRRVLGAGAIQTVPGFGYRLELPVSRNAMPPPPADTPLAAAAATPRPRLPPRGWPERLAPLVGRERELEELSETLARASLVTLAGVAGVGKTRLAQELIALAAPEQGGAAWVSLRPLADVHHVPGAIALAVGIALPERADAFAALVPALDEWPLLLVLDGAEHLCAALAVPLGTLVQQARGLRLLLTSQAPLGVAGEHVFRLAPLAVPPPGTAPEEAAKHAAVRLFAERAAAVDRRFALSATNCAPVVEICRRLDGNPLALELAAARAPALGISALLDHLDDRFRLLRQAGTAADPRHGTLHAAFDWSYGLLSAAEQRVFDALGVFAGSFALETGAHCVADDTIDVADAVDLIGRLVDRSLVTTLPLEPPRHALSETARHFARAHLDASGRCAALRRRMASTLLERLDAAYDEYWSLDEAHWLARYAPDLDNVRAALDWATTSDPELAVALYGSAWPLFVETDLNAEGRSRFEQVVTRLRDGLPRARVGRFWEAVANYESLRRYDRARYAAELAAVLHEAAGDVRARYQGLLLLALNWRGDDAAAHAALAAARALEDPAWPARLLALGALVEGELAAATGEHELARVAFAQAVRHALATSERLALAATVCIVELDVAGGDAAAALQLARPLMSSLAHTGRLETRFELLALALGALLLAGEVAAARDCGAELLALARRFGGSGLAGALDAMGCLALADGRTRIAARVAALADRELAAHGQPARSPAQQRLRAALDAGLAAALGGAWRETLRVADLPADTLVACALALGLQA